MVNAVWPFVLLLVLKIRPSCCRHGSDDYDDYVKEVLEEDYRNDEDYNDNPYDDLEREEMLRKKEEERISEEKRVAKEKADQAARDREAKFEAEVSRMSAEKQKAAKRQKRKDAKIVKRVLNAARHENHYGVLGLRNWEMKVNPRTISLGPKKLTIPGFKLFHLTPSKIRKAYRSRAMAVHPDKNRDGRANEAFIAVENSASILSDDKLREEYDVKLRRIRSKQRQQVSKVTREIINGTLDSLQKTVAAFRTVLGPFALPVFILGALII